MEERLTKSWAELRLRMLFHVFFPETASSGCHSDLGINGVRRGSLGL